VLTGPGLSAAQPMRPEDPIAPVRALLWDVDGTIAETERDGHRVAFNLAFEASGCPWHWDVDTYGRLLSIAGGRERLLAFMAGRADAPAGAAAREALARGLHARKNLFYAARVERGHIGARPGVLRLMDECRDAGIAQAIVTTTSRSNVEALLPALLGAHWRERFAAVLCAEDAPAKKPDPQVYWRALERLGLAPAQAFAIEDSPNGLAAARAAGVACGITRGAYFRDAVFDGAAWVRDDLDAPPPVTASGLRVAAGAPAAAGAPITPTA
jgi:HAD superfamily hydrolase (TIGR01509 family)